MTKQNGKLYSGLALIFIVGSLLAGCGFVSTGSAEGADEFVKQYYSDLENEDYQEAQERFASKATIANQPVDTKTLEQLANEASQDSGSIKSVTVKAKYKSEFFGLTKKKKKVTTHAVVTVKRENKDYKINLTLKNSVLKPTDYQIVKADGI
ncbi:hypothetical protein [Fictibacillus barbaricus]|uniref:DUF4878 domain-containing protein n=1 Tax=Fictibacillus barbaricus TaxID=182136 RepID=A0ABS2Z9P4_9BACL|nr:hypothetical protein [Fictibacillus barbaricus]MBN3544161.1 hypothetical protein [Fictibacillus barbaricus]GGB69415.1 hypothetical protein GCM10007199_39540 [Fictibacillus barbaricus]